MFVIVLVKKGYFLNTLSGIEPFVLTLVKLEGSKIFSYDSRKRG